MILLIILCKYLFFYEKKIFLHQIFRTMLSETEQLLTDMEHTSTSKFVNVHEQIVRAQQHVLDIQSDVQRDEATFVQINQAYQQVYLQFSFSILFKN